jgi:hypothetical protein
LAGLVVAVWGWRGVRRWRAVERSREAVQVTVIAAGPADLTVRFAAADGAELDVDVPVRPALAARWRSQLERGEPPREEPDFEDPVPWNSLPGRYDPAAQPPLLLDVQVEAPRTAAQVRLVAGVLLAVICLLAMDRTVTLLTLAAASSALAALFGRWAVGSVAGRRRTDRSWRSVAGEAGAAALCALFLGGSAVLAVVAAFRR